jgi:predicted dehydrogenase
MIRVGIVGAGSMARTHARAYATIPGVTVAALMDPDSSRAAALAAAIGAPPYADLEQMLASARLDVVDCCAPTPFHRATVERAAARGCQVICEKPLALTMQDARAMIAAARDAGVALLVGQVVRFFPEYRRLSAALAAGQIGAPVSLSMLRQTAYPAGHDGWYLDEARSGGIFLDLMVHDFDWALWQLGPAQRVFARLVRYQGARRFTQGMATIRHRSGAISHIAGAWGHPGGFTTMVELAGDGGLLRHHSAESRAFGIAVPPRAESAPPVELPDLSGGEDPYRAELSHFMDVLAGHAAPLVTPEQSLQALALALAARASAQSGSVQLIEEVQP